jgi:signal transduction histidine kinase
MSRYKRILIAVIAGYLAGMIASVVLSYRYTLRQAETATLMRLGGIANSLALQIDGDRHAQLMRRYTTKDAIRTNEQDSTYFDLHRMLARNYVANMLHSPIYTIIYDSLSSGYAFGVTSAEMPYFRHSYRSAPVALMEKHLEGAMIPMYTDEFGTWLSAFAAIKDKKGAVVALVQADEHFNEFIVEARKNAMNNSAVILLIFVILMAVLLRIIQPLLAREQKDKRLIESAHEQIKQLDDFRKEMLANLSHDLRTPMANIMGYAETLHLKNASISPDTREKYLSVIALESRRMNTMIAQLFDLSKFEAGQITLKKEPVNLSELAQDNFYKYTETAKEKSVRLITEIQQPLPLVSVDIAWIDRVVQNLLDNAFKYVNEGGLVKITIYTEMEHLHFKVCNSGKPIKQEHLPHIFDRYFRVAHKGTESTGLGLAIVKKVIELHGGRVWAEVSNDLTTFRFEINMI